MDFNSERPSCSKCFAKYTKENRVNWWSKQGEPHGPLTHSNTDIPLCDECAAELYAGRNTVRSMLDVDIMRPSEEKEVKLFLTKYLDAGTNPSVEKLLDDYIILVARVKQNIVGFCAFRAEEEFRGCEKYFIHFAGVYVEKTFRCFGIGSDLFDSFLSRVSGLDIHYIKPELPITEDVEKYLWDSRLVLLEQDGFEDCYRLR